jgi:hypothetical protein
MIMQAVHLGVVLTALVCAAACGAEQDTSAARVTIDVRCDTDADCPNGFSCEAEEEHGPPTTMCESPEVVSCPPGYDTKIGHGQTFCKPVAGAVARGGHGAMASTRRGLKTRSADGHTAWASR